MYRSEPQQRNKGSGVGKGSTWPRGSSSSESRLPIHLLSRLSASDFKPSQIFVIKQSAAFRGCGDALSCSTRRTPSSLATENNKHLNKVPRHVPTISPEVGRFCLGQQWSRSSLAGNVAILTGPQKAPFPSRPSDN